MHIVEIVDTLSTGGTQRMLVQFANMCRQHGIALTVIGLQTARERSITDALAAVGAEVREFSAPRILHWPRIRAIRNLLQSRPFDLVQTQLMYANVDGVLAARLAGLPVIASLRSAAVGRDIDRVLRTPLETFTLRFVAQRVMANGHAVAAGHRQRLGYRRIDVITNAITPETTSLDTQTRRDLRTSLSGDPTRPVVLAVGRLTDAKDYPTLLAAHVKVLSTHPSACLWIVGDGYLRKQLLARRDRLGLTEAQVVFAGRRHDVPQLLAAADVFVQSSRREGTSVAVMEAMRAGIPVVATTAGENARLLAQQRGVLVDKESPARLAAALVAQLDDLPAAQAMAARAQAHLLHHYRVDRWFNQYLTLFREVLTREGHQRHAPAKEGAV